MIFFLSVFSDHHCRVQPLYHLTNCAKYDIGLPVMDLAPYANPRSLFLRLSSRLSPKISGQLYGHGESGKGRGRCSDRSQRPPVDCTVADRTAAVAVATIYQRRPPTRPYTPTDRQTDNRGNSGQAQISPPICGFRSAIPMARRKPLFL